MGWTGDGLGVDEEDALSVFCFLFFGLIVESPVVFPMWSKQYDAALKMQMCFEYFITGRCSKSILDNLVNVPKVDLEKGLIDMSLFYPQ